jgi:hypothetical protein
VKSAICLSRRLAGAVVVSLVCSLAVAQQANPPAPQSNPPPSQSNPSQLPDAPGPVLAPARAQTGGAAQQQTGSSSSSTPMRLYWSEANPNVQVTVLENTRLSVMTNTPINTAKVRVGEPLVFTLEEDVLVDDLLVIPRGATLHGAVVEVKKAGKLAGTPNLILRLVSLDLEGRTYPVYSYLFQVEGTSKAKPTEKKISDGAAIGAIVAESINLSAAAPATIGGKEIVLATGAAAGATVGTVVAAASPSPVIDIPAESQIDFYLASPMSVAPVSRREAQRLSEGLYSGGPVLYVRGERP